MYEDLKKQLQDYAAGTMRDDDAEIAFDALNAIEKLEHKVLILEGDREGLLAQIHRWIPVTERLPEKMQYVLVRYQNNDMAVASWFGGDEDIRFWRAMTDEGWCADCDTEPTLWMPLPKGPEEE